MAEVGGNQTRRYTHVAAQELHEAAEAIANRVGLSAALEATEQAAIVTPAVRSEAGTADEARPGARAERFQGNRPDTR